MRLILISLLTFGCASPILLELEETPSPLENAVAEVEALEQPVRTVGPDLPVVPEELYHRVTPIADLSLESNTESEVCPPPVIDYWMEPVEPIAPVDVAPPTSKDKTSMVALLLSVIVLGAVPFLIYTYTGMWRAWRFRKNNA